MGYANVPSFQYPRTDRLRCNKMLRLISIVNRATFSILERIVYAVTAAPQVLGVEWPIFQYPRTDRLRCNRRPPVR